MIKSKIDKKNMRYKAILEDKKAYLDLLTGK